MNRINVSRRHLPMLVLGCIAVVAGLALAWQSGWISSLLSDDTVPSFKLENRKGERISSESLRGRPALVHFWASWCAPCLEELPAWLKKVEQTGDSPMRFVAISLDTKWSDADSVLAKSTVPAALILLIDPEQKSSDSFGSFQFPETYLLDSDGRVVRKWVGAQNWAAMDFNRLLPEDRR